MFKKISILVILVFMSCSFETPTNFTPEALNEKVYSLDESSSTFQEILNKHKGNKILIDFWASWCRDCIEGLSEVKKLQKEFPKITFLFLSVDTRKNSWKRGIQRYKITGEHYNLPKGMKDGALVDFIGLGWIPRYMVIDELGKIALFKATDASDDEIIQALKKAI